MSTVPDISFDRYLTSLVRQYEQWWRLYTLTDATGRESQRVEREQIAPTFFDFGLMVQTVVLEDKEKVESRKEKEEEKKIERLPVLEGICKYAAEHVLLVGRPGSGKSTALARLLLQEAENALRDGDRLAKIPVLVELRYLPSEANERSVIKYIRDFGFRKHDPALNLDDKTIENLLFQERLLLLVDGVNELPSDDSRKQVIKFRELYQKTCPMIFTTRELSASGDLGIAKRLEMQPLTEPQMQQFVMAYLPTQGEKLLRQLSGRLREFGQTPLLLWMLCSLFQQSEQIPPNLGMVFRAFTVGYGDRIKQDVTLSKDSRAWWGRLLQYLAFKMTCGENLTELQVAISRREAEQFLVEFLRGKVEFADDCAVRWLEDLLKHHLIQISNDRIEFRHQLIQEYYAAEWLLGLLQSLSDARLQQGYLNYLKWTEPLALMLELVEGEEQAVRVVRLALEVDLRLGARLAGAVKYGFQEKTVGLLMREIDERKIPKLYAIELLGETRSDYCVINALVSDLNDSDYNVRIHTVDALGKIGGEKAVETLIQSLKDLDYNVRIHTVDALGKIGGEKAVEPLIQSLEDLDCNARIHAVDALGKIGGEKAVEPLIQSLEDSDSYVRMYAAEALGNIKSEKAVEPLIQSLKDSVSYVRMYAAEALGNIKSEKTVEPLIEELREQTIHIRRRIAESRMINSKEGLFGKNRLKILRDKTCSIISLIIRFILSKLFTVFIQQSNEEEVEPLIQDLKDQDSNIYTTEILENNGGDEGVEPLIQDLKDQDSNIYKTEILENISSYKDIKFLIKCLIYEDSDMSMHAVKALKEISGDKVVRPLIKALTTAPYHYVLWEAADILGNIRNNNDKAVEPLIQALKDEDSDVRRSAAEVLGNIGSCKAIQPLVQALTYQDSYLRRSAAHSLGNIRNDKAVEPLIQALKDEDFDVRIYAAKALGNIRSDKAIKPLTQILMDQDYDMRRSVAETLGNIGSDKAVEPLIQALKEEDYDVRIYAAEALGKIGSDKALEPLIQLLTDKDSEVRKSTIEALGKIGSDKALEPLIQLLTDKDFRVRVSVIEALGNIGGYKATEPLIKALKDYDSSIVEIAIETLSKLGNRKVSIVTFALLEILESNNSSLCMKAAKTLGKIGGEISVKFLIPLLQDKVFSVRQSASEALSKISSPMLIDYLYKLIPTTYGLNEIPFVISNIQSRCKYYNYDIAQTPLQETNTSNIASSGNTIVNIQSEKIYMSDTSNPNISISISGGQIGEFITGNKNVHGNEIGTQNIYYGTDDPNTQQLANELVEILQGIVPQISDPTSEAGKEIITAAAMEEIENKPTLKDRLVAALKAGAFEAIKKIAKNDFVEVFLTAFKAGLEAKPKK